MSYIIYTPSSKALVRHEQITEDAIAAGFLNNGEKYDAVLQHPMEDRAAIEVVVMEPIYYQGLPTQRYDYSIFFTPQEIARSVDVLPEDWFENNNEEV